MRAEREKREPPATGTDPLPAGRLHGDDDGEETLMRPRCGGRGYRREARVSIDRREARVSTGRREESDERMS